MATDKAGNSRELRLAYTLKDVKYKKSTIPVSDDFIQGKSRPFWPTSGHAREVRRIFLSR